MLIAVSIHPPSLAGRHSLLSERMRVLPNQAVKASSISAMKSNTMANTQNDVNHLRKGGAGGWRDVFSVRQSENFDELYKAQMKGSGLEMDFGEGLVM